MGSFRAHSGGANGGTAGRGGRLEDAHTKTKHHVLTICVLAAAVHCASTDELPVDARGDAIAVGTAGAPDDAGTDLDAGGSVSTGGRAGAPDYDASSHQMLPGCQYQGDDGICDLRAGGSIPYHYICTRDVHGFFPMVPDGWYCGDDGAQYVDHDKSGQCCDH